MSVIRQFNWLGQQRVDVPHLRMLESAAADDWDVYAGAMVAGGAPYVMKGFAFAAATTGTPATSLQLQIQGGLLVHPLATATGSLFAPAAGRTVETLGVSNARVQGSFTAAAVNYVGIDLVRSADATTADLEQFLDIDTGSETPKDVPLGLTLDYVIVISTQPFSTTPTLAPIAKVTTDSNNNLAANGLQDARGMMWRLGAGGDVPDAAHAYPWPSGRTETAGNLGFGGGDKAIDSQKAWGDAVMTRLWEVGGGEHWYSPTADRNVHLLYNGTTLFTNGEYYEWSGTNLHWRELRFVFDNSTAYYNDVADQLVDSPGLTNLADGECLFVDLDRTTNRTGGTALTAQKAVLATLGTPLVPGSRFVFAWRIGSSVFTRDRAYAVGTTFAPATTSALGLVKLAVTSGTPLAPVVFNPDTNGALTVTAAGGNAAGVTGTGNGTGAGVSGTGGATNAAGVIGTGGGTGIGVVGTGGTNGIGVQGVGKGTAAGVDAVADGSGTGSALIARAAGTNTAPVIRPQDSAGHVHAYYDWIGLPGGRISEIYQTWYDLVDTTPTASTSGFVSLKAGWDWSGNAVTSGTVSLTGSGVSNTDSNGTMLTPVGASSPQPGSIVAVATTRKLLSAFGAGICVTAEFEITTTTLAKSNLFVGFSNSKFAGGALTGGSFIAIGYRAATDTTLQVIHANNPTAVSFDNTAVTLVANATYRIRLELLASDNPLNGTASVRVYVNGNLTNTITGNIPAGLNRDMYFLYWEEIAAASTSFGNALGGLNIRWNRTQFANGLY